MTGQRFVGGKFVINKIQIYFYMLGGLGRCGRRILEAYQALNLDLIYLDQRYRNS